MFKIQVQHRQPWMHGMKLSVCNTDAVCQDPLCTVKGIAENLFDVQECLHLHTHESISHSAFWRNKPLTNLYCGSKWLAAHEKLWQFFIINVDHLLIHDRAQTNGAHCTWSTCAFILYTEQFGQNNKHLVNISFKRLVAHGALCRYSCGAIASVLYTSFKRYEYIYISKWNSNNHVVFRVYGKRLLASIIAVVVVVVVAFVNMRSHFKLVFPLCIPILDSQSHVHQFIRVMINLFTQKLYGFIEVTNFVLGCDQCDRCPRRRTAYRIRISPHSHSFTSYQWNIRRIRMRSALLHYISFENSFSSIFFSTEKYVSLG